MARGRPSPRRAGRRPRSGSATFGSSNAQTLNIGVAAALVAALPILVLLLIFQRQLVRGLTAGAVKG